MAAKWGSCIVLAICLAFLSGCRTTQPNLKPTTTEERYATPPLEPRYETASYPKAAFDKGDDPARRLLDDKKSPNPMGGRNGMQQAGGMGAMR